MATRTAKIILGAAVFDDILGMVLLAVVAGLASRWRAGVAAPRSSGHRGSGIHIVHDFRRPADCSQNPAGNGSPLHAARSPAGRSRTVPVNVLAIGSNRHGRAFFAGLMFADYAPQWNLLPRVGGITEFLAPVFFFTIGSRLNVHLFTGNVLYAEIVISFLAIVSQLMGCGLPLWREGRLSALQVGVGMMPRGEVALIVALVGL